VTTAGISVSAAISVTATAIASVGPSERKMLSEESSRATNATITTLAAEAITSPTRSTAVATACFGVSPARSRSR
jgi:hypothetical protein